ncbi:Non-canonical non-ribosomal peptide synthetase FUB8 [Colletotrichum orbiculare MAFF 240422]|uniref:Non-canonical non-ribosomal peptide synthetase FUB8 n=1 Tax=Colletotrichum orbiculare (strain 104-T / ATCC 96160 / CBS 514.97 / LARS 414 / MAFF 240422) TaxID=1213857 RepID=A0A484FCT6_COLOR|nr:Non-canonical non-ribosomal peptide synthetase FUB8 [Colletotrichum orbiculare MAFF 240422]
MEEVSPPYGERLIPSLIDFNAKTTPTEECFSVPRTNSAKDGWRQVSWSQYANAINRVAASILQTCGPAPAKAYPTIAYIGANDARYLVFVVAAVKAGYKALLISPRNSEEGQLNLFELTDCHIIYHDTLVASMVKPWLKERTMKAVVIDSLDACLDDEPVPHVAFDYTFAEARWAPFAVLHTSGSTGLPKPVTVRHGVFGSSDLFHNLPKLQGSHIFLREYSESKRSFLPLPLFHASGLYGFFGGLFWDFSVALPMPMAMFTADLVLEILTHSGCDSIFLPPSILEDLSNRPEAVAVLKSLKFVGFGGGNLAPNVGNRLVDNGIVLHNAIGSTEVTAFPYYWQTNMKLWDWHIINSDVLGADWRKAEGEDDDVYELVIRRQDKEPGMQGIFYHMPDLDEFSTRDLFKKHPTEPNHWRYHGRIDNTIVFSNGEKLNPVSFEETLAGHPAVKAALVVGSMRFQPALLVELVTPPASEAEARAAVDEVWPLVARVNKSTVAHGRVSRHLIAFAKADKPFPRLDKDTVRRNEAAKLYEEEIDGLYQRAAQFAPSPDVKMDTSSPEALLNSILALLGGVGIVSLEADSDLFISGVDSLQVLDICGLLRGGLKAAGIELEPELLAPSSVYNNPSPRRLADYLHAVISGTGEEGLIGRENQVRTMEAFLAKYTAHLPPNKRKPDPNDEKQVVVLTGSTGRLGSLLLDFLVSSPNVTKVICLTRATDGQARQLAALTSHGLHTNLESVEFLHADLSKSDLGMDGTVYSRLLAEVDRVIHCQWSVNFNLSVASFEKHIAGVRHLADFSLAAQRNVPVVFVSSVLSTIGKAGSEREGDLARPTTGYGRSKLVGELILKAAAEVSGLPAAIVRVGQIAGQEAGSAGSGIWSKQDWLPSIIGSSVQTLGVLPRDLGVMNGIRWLPVDRVARLVLDIAGISEPIRVASITGCFYGINPHKARWGDLVPEVAALYGDKIRELVDWETWLGVLEESSARDLDKGPAFKLLGFLKHSMVEAGDVEDQLAASTAGDLERTLGVSRTLRETSAVSPGLMVKWCREWGY